MSTRTCFGAVLQAPVSIRGRRALPHRAHALPTPSTVRASPSTGNGSKTSCTRGCAPRSTSRPARKSLWRRPSAATGRCCAPTRSASRNKTSSTPSISVPGYFPENGRNDVIANCLRRLMSFRVRNGPHWYDTTIFADIPLFVFFKTPGFRRHRRDVCCFFPALSANGMGRVDAVTTLTRFLLQIRCR